MSVDALIPQEHQPIIPHYNIELWENFPTWYQLELRDNFPFLLQQVLGYLRETGADIVDFADFHYDWIQTIQRPTPEGHQEKDIIVSFRDSAKTMFYSFLTPLSYIQQDHKFVFLTGESQGQSRLNLENIENFVDEWPPLRYLKGSIWNRDQAKFSNGSRIQAKSLGGQTRGAKTLRERPSLIICDDLIPDKLKMPMPWYIETFHSLIAALARTGRIILVGTPFNPADLIADIMKRADWYKYKKAILENDVSTWLAKWSTALVLEKKANTPPLVWARNYAVTPVFAEGITFDTNWLRTCEHDWIPQAEFIRVMAVDPAIRKVETAKGDPDYFAITILDYFYRVYLAKILLQFHARLNFPKQKEKVAELGTEYQQRLYNNTDIQSKGFYCVIESNFYQAALGQELKKAVNFSVVEFDQTKDKVERLTELTVPYQNAEIWHAGVVHPDYVIEYSGFPRKDIKRDMLDSTHLAFFWAKVFGSRLGRQSAPMVGFDY